MCSTIRGAMQKRPLRLNSTVALTLRLSSKPHSPSEPQISRDVEAINGPQEESGSDVERQEESRVPPKVKGEGGTTKAQLDRIRKV